MNALPPRLSDLQSPLHSPSNSVSHTPLCSPLNSQTSSDTQLCWICFDDESEEVLLINTCGCKNRLVHASCLAKWIERSRQTECKVCTQKWHDIFVSSSRPSEMLSAAVPARLRHPEPREIAWNAITFLFSVGFVYGGVYGGFASDVVSQVFIATTSNFVIISLWNKMCACPLRRTSLKSAYEDVALLVGTYVFFLFGWIIGFLLIVPHLSVFMYRGMIGHSFNFGACFFTSFLRCFCTKTMEGEDDGAA